MDRQWGFRIRAVHAGAIPDAATTRAHFVFEDTDDAASIRSQRGHDSFLVEFDQINAVRADALT